MCPLGPAYDEVFVGSNPRPQYASLLGALEGRDLGELEREAEAHLAAEGVTFRSADGDPSFTIDPVPRIITAEEWEELEAGLAQRARALAAFVVDAHGARAAVAEAVVPAEVLETAAHLEPVLAGCALPIAVVGFDVVRHSCGCFCVLEDNVRTPSGLTYALAARETCDTLLPVPEGRLELDGVLDALGSALRAAAPEGVDDPCVVLLSDGPQTSAFYEHEVIARELGLPLVRPTDLRVSRGELYARTGAGRVKVDVIYRRTAEERLTRPDGRPTPLGRLLLPALLARRVTCVNSFGAGVADDKLVHAYVDDLVRFFLDEAPILRSVPTYDLRDEHRREALLARIGDLVIKPRHESGGEGVMIGPHASDEVLARVAAEVRAHPDHWVAQETFELSRAPVIADGRLELRHVDLRAFAILEGDHATVVPGGLTRVAGDPVSLMVNSSRAGGAKDTWVLR